MSADMSAELAPIGAPVAPVPWYKVALTRIGSARPGDTVDSFVWVQAPDAQAAKRHPDVARHVALSWSDSAYRMSARKGTPRTFRVRRSRRRFSLISS